MPIYKRKKANGDEYYFVTASGYDKFGKRHQPGRHARGIKEAEKIERQLFVELAELKQNGPSITVQAFLPEYIHFIEYKRKKTKGSVDSEKSLLEKHVVPYFKDKPVSEIKTSNIEFIIDEVLKNHSSQTKKHALNYLRAFFDLAIRRDLIRDNPCRMVEKISVAHKAKVVLNQEQIVRFLVAAKTYYPDWYPVVLTVLHCGFRANEIRGLQWGDVSWSPDADMIYLRRVLNVKGGLKPYPKNKQARPLPVAPELKEELTALRARGNFDDDEWIFERLPELMRNEQAKIARAICRVAGVPECTFHALRAAAITHFFNAGLPLPVIKKIAGHKRLSSTDIYYHESGEIVKNSTKNISFIPKISDKKDESESE